MPPAATIKISVNGLDTPELDDKGMPEAAFPSAAVLGLVNVGV